MSSIATQFDKTGISNFIVNSVKTALSVKDKIYLAKFYKFWNAAEEHSLSVDAFIKKTKERGNWQKVGENFLLAIDGLSSFDKCYYYGKIWIAWLEKEIDTNELIEITHILQNIFITDLHHIMHNSKEENFTYKNEDRLYNCGFLERREIEGEINNVDFSDYRSESKQIEDNISHILSELSSPYVETKLAKKLINILGPIPTPVES